MSSTKGLTKGRNSPLRRAEHAKEHTAGLLARQLFGPSSEAIALGPMLIFRWAPLGNARE